MHPNCVLRDSLLCSLCHCDQAALATALANFAGHPLLAQVAYEVERSGDEDYVFGRGEFDGACKGLRRVGHSPIGSFLGTWSPNIVIPVGVSSCGKFIVPRSVGAYDAQARGLNLEFVVSTRHNVPVEIQSRFELKSVKVRQFHG